MSRRVGPVAASRGRPGPGTPSRPAGRQPHHRAGGPRTTGGAAGGSAGGSAAAGPGPGARSVRRPVPREAARSVRRPVRGRRRSARVAHRPPGARAADPVGRSSAGALTRTVVRR
ncbi:hypothetical protein SGPA1_41283 [Streptomyces misionensis JCM 4497]